MQEEIGMVFRLTRVRQRRTLKEVAKQVGIHYTLLSQIELGRINPRPDEVKRICKALGLPSAKVRQETRRKAMEVSR